MKLRHGYRRKNEYDHAVCAVSFLADNNDKTPKDCTVHYKASDHETYSQFGDKCAGEFTSTFPISLVLRSHTRELGVHHGIELSFFVHCIGYHNSSVDFSVCALPRTPYFPARPLRRSLKARAATPANRTNASDLFITLMFLIVVSQFRDAYIPQRWMRNK